MPVHMLPRAIHVHASFPRTASGKIDRQAVRA
jgi:acyl-coenzyme A synthetase/AMP-(fatty) acid ligase